MKKIIVTLFFISISVLAEVNRPTVVLLTSVENPEILWGLKKYPLDERTEKIFRKAFEKSGYNVVIKHKADQYDLWQALHAPENIAVFWLSHAAPSVSIGSEIKLESIIGNVEGGNVRHIFDNIHPNLRLLSIIGCKADDITEELKIKNGNFMHNRLLHIHSPKKMVQPERGLIQAIIQSSTIIGNRNLTNLNESFCMFDGSCNKTKRYPKIIAKTSILTNPFKMPCNKKIGLPITIHRNIPHDVNPERLTSISIVMNQKTLIVFPKGTPGTIQTISAHIDYDDLLFSSRNNLKITVESATSINRKPKPYLEGITFEASWKNASWNVFSVDGVPIGSSQNIYLYTGPLNVDARTQEYFPYKCNYKQNHTGLLNVSHCFQKSNIKSQIRDILKFSF